MTSENLSFILTLFSMAMYALSGVIYIFNKKKFAFIFTAVGWISNLGIILVHWIVNSYPPFANIYQILSVLSFILPIISVLILKFKSDLNFTFVYFILGAIVPLLGTLFIENEIKWALVPALQSVWFVPHVFSYMISYALAAVAFLMTVRFFVYKNKKEQSFNATVVIVRLALPFMINGLVLGAIWADQIWGNFWQWDIKEIWSLITCLFYLAGLHFAKDKRNKITIIIFILGFISLIITFFFVNVLPGAVDSQHTYS